MPTHPKFQRYQVLGRLATGGMAEVWLGRSVGFAGFEKLVVLKTILPNLLTNPQFVQMFVHEAKVAAMLNHPNCVQIFELGKEGETLYIAMEYIDGFALSRILKRAKSRNVLVPMEVLVRILSDALAGLDYAHRLTDREGRPLGLIHRDVSPDNLLVSFSGQSKLVDFGIAKAATSTMAQTRAGTVKGKFGYIAPEYLRGEKIDGRADLFALGVVMYRALTGMRPFTGPSEAAVTMAVLRDDPKWPSDLDPNLPQAMSAAVMMALEKKPEARFDSARSMRQALEAAVRPADAEVVGAFLQALWPPGDPERVALESLAQGRAEETSEPVLESVVSSGFELPQGALHTPRPRIAHQHATSGGGVPKSVDVPVRDLEDDESPRRGGALRWVAFLLAVGLGVGAVVKLEPFGPHIVPALFQPAPAPVVEPAAVGAPAPTPTPAVAAAPVEPVEAPAVPAVPESPSKLTVEVDQAVTVFLDDKELGKAPGPFDLEPGLRKVRLKGQGIDQLFELTVNAGEPLRIAELRKGSVSVKAEPWAYVKIDGRSHGQTPVKRELFEGPHVVELSNTELNVTKRTDVRIKAGETKTVSVNLEE